MAPLRASDSASGCGGQLEAVAAWATPAVSSMAGSLTPAKRAWEASSPRWSAAIWFSWPLLCWVRR